MTSVQLLQNSSVGTTMRKQGHLEAGKKRLEEFRKKKAEGKAKKAALTGQLQSPDVNNLERLSEDQHASNARTLRTESSTTSSSSEIDLKLRPSTRGGPTDITNKSVEAGESRREPQSSFELTKLVDDYYSHEMKKNNLPFNESVNNQRNSFPSAPVASMFDAKDFGRSTISEEDKFEIFSSTSSTNKDPISNASLEEKTVSSYEDATNEKGVHVSNSGIKLSDLTSQLLSSLDSASAIKRPALPPAPSITSFPTTSGRARLSFHDFLNRSRPSSTGSLLSFSQAEEESAISFNGQQLSSQRADGLDIEEAATVDNLNRNEIKAPFSKDLSSNNAIVDGVGSKPPDLLSSTKNEDFSILEQHIEDLTQEKFSLQRALESSRSLAESLASENSSLTENYNQQRKMINELKLEMEHMQDEMKAHLAAVETAKMEAANALLECSAADERAKILASEVIGLEDKALRLRSNELKLEKQLEGLSSEISSYKRKLSSLEKERNDFQSTIEALQEEKSLLLSKVRKTALNDRVDASSESSPKKDAFTSTDDLDVRDGDNSSGLTSVFDVSPSPSGERHGDLFYNISSLHFPLESSQPPLPDLPSIVPLEQQRIIANINSLILELTLEKEELLHALRAQSDNYSKLMDAHKDLSQKLERQTQKLEFLTAQRASGEAVFERPVQAQNLQEATGYTDEGDEVVERVLSWILKLFPGGPSKRRTSKLL